MATYSKEVLTGGALGVGIEVDQTTVGAAVTIHQVPNTASLVDEIWLYATNTSGAAIDLTVWWGGVAVGDNDIIASIPSQSGLTLISPGLVLGQNLVIKAHAAAAAGVIIYGYANRVTP